MDDIRRADPNTGAGKAAKDVQGFLDNYFTDAQAKQLSLALVKFIKKILD